MSALDQLLSDTSSGCCVIPGCYDRLSAALVERNGFPAVVLSGASIQASYAGFSDAPELTDFVAATAHVAAATALPLIVDGEDGFGAPAEAASALLDAGAVGLHIEDYSTHSGELADPAEFAKTMGTVADLVLGKDGVLVIRTDGLRKSPDEAIDRAKRYAECGPVGAVLPFLGPLLQPKAKGQLLTFLEDLVSSVSVPVVAYAPLGFELSAAECTSVGVRLLLVPQLLVGAATGAVQRALDVVADVDLARRFTQDSDVWDLRRLREVS